MVNGRLVLLAGMPLVLIFAACSSTPAAEPAPTPNIDADVTNKPATTSTTPTTSLTSVGQSEVTETSNDRADLEEVEVDPSMIDLPGGCYDGPDWSGELEIATHGRDGEPIEGSPLQFDLNNDGRDDQIYSISPGQGGTRVLRGFLGDLGWTSAAEGYINLHDVVGVADLDRDGADEVLVLHAGNNFSTVAVLHLDGCDLRAASDAVLPGKSAGFRLWCSSISCVGDEARFDCISDETGDWIREDRLTIVPEQIAAYMDGTNEQPDAVHLISESRLVDGVIVTTTTSETLVQYAEPFPARFDNDHFVETCWPGPSD